MFPTYNCCHILNTDIIKIKRGTKIFIAKYICYPCHVVELYNIINPIWAGGHICPPPPLDFTL